MKNMKGEVNVTRDEVMSSHPEVYNRFLGILRRSDSISSHKDEEEIEWFIQWGSFVKKAKTQDEREENLNSLMNKPYMNYEDRLEYEFSILRMNLHMKAGNFQMVDRMYKDTKPSPSIVKLVEEITKLTMIVEQDSLEKMSGENDDVFSSIVKDSIPDLDREYIGEENIENSIGRSLEEEEEEEVLNFNIDDILDKISESGMSSLTDSEREFLENNSNK